MGGTTTAGSFELEPKVEELVEPNPELPGLLGLLVEEANPELALLAFVELKPGLDPKLEPVPFGAFPPMGLVALIGLTLESIMMPPGPA